MLMLSLPFCIKTFGLCVNPRLSLIVLDFSPLTILNTIHTTRGGRCLFNFSGPFGSVPWVPSKRLCFYDTPRQGFFCLCLTVILNLWPCIPPPPPRPRRPPVAGKLQGKGSGNPIHFFLSAARPEPGWIRKSTQPQAVGMSACWEILPCF